VYPPSGIRGQMLVVTGGWLKTAALRAEEWLEKELGRRSRTCVAATSGSRRVQLCAPTCCRSPRSSGNRAQVLVPRRMGERGSHRLHSFQEWWRVATRNTQEREEVGQARRRGSDRDLDDELVAGIVAINNETPVRQGRRFLTTVRRTSM